VAVQVRDLWHRYPASQAWALRGIGAEIIEGEWLAIVGVNGSGKSTLVKHLNGLLRPTRGKVRVGGKDTNAAEVGELARTVSYLPQNPDHLIFSSTVRQEVAFGPRQQGLRQARLDERVGEALTALDLTVYAEHPPAVLGYGLRRKVALASVLAMRTPVLALDEPTVGLDRASIERLLDVVAARHQVGTTVIMVTHDLRWVARYAQRVLVLYRGEIALHGPTEAVLSDREALRAVDLEPLPVTELAYALGWAPPLPVSVNGFCSGVCSG
jgi:energy-coupling factor transport system ATP-binding protein